MIRLERQEFRAMGTSCAVAVYASASGRSRALCALAAAREEVAECERVSRLTGDATVSLADLALAKGRAGDRDGARRILRELEARHAKQYVPGDVLAKALVGAGYNERAIDALAQAFESRGDAPLG